MEELRSLVPEDIKRAISLSTTEDTSSTCSLLTQFFIHLPKFQLLVRELTDKEMSLCVKNMSSALDFKRKGNDSFTKGDIMSSLRFYNQALRFVPMRADIMDKTIVATIYTNRATCLFKMRHLLECIRDCNRAIILNPRYSKAWYRRGQANASLGNYDDTIHNLNVALEMESSSLRKKQIVEDLKSVLGRSAVEACNTNNLSLDDNVVNMNSFDGDKTSLKCIRMPEKGRGLISSTDVHPSSLLLTEEPFAAVVLKEFRETHCHFCFNELPLDWIPCSSCTIPLYCCISCKKLACGYETDDCSSFMQHGHLSAELESYITKKIIGRLMNTESTGGNPEHRHECGGANWPAVFPSDIILAGRILVKTMEMKRHSHDLHLNYTLDLPHNYMLLCEEVKVDLHIYSIVLGYCLRHSNESDCLSLEALASVVLCLKLGQ